jgi:Protein of Unknown function (DUF2604)
VGLDVFGFHIASNELNIYIKPVRGLSRRRGWGESTGFRKEREVSKNDKGGGNSGHGGGGGGGHGNDKIDLIILVGGDEIDIKAKPDDTLRDLAEKALKKSENVGQPLENWDMRSEAGELLDLDRQVGSYNFANGALLSLTLKAGIAG